MKNKTSKLKSWIFRAEKRTSLEQLTLDFGEFPPYPLNAAAPKYSFNILHINNKLRKTANTPWEVVNTTKIIAKGIKSGELTKLVTELKTTWQLHYRDIKEGLIQLFTDIHRDREKLKNEKNWLKLTWHYILYITLLPLALIILTAMLIALPMLSIAVILFNLTKGFIAISIVEKNTIGSASTQVDAPDEISLFISKNNIKHEPTISHEHIHFLQKKHYIETNTQSSSDPNPIENIRLYLSKNLAQEIDADKELKRRLNYLLSKDEVEARLHELIINFYTHRKTTPSNSYEFINSLILSSENIKNITASNLTKTYKKLMQPIENKSDNSELLYELGTCTLKKKIFKLFIESIEKHRNEPEEENIFFDSINIRQRDAYALEDLDFLITYLCDKNTNFIFEVLPVLYANLVGYYGDAEFSSKLHSEVPKSEYYYQLYPEELTSTLGTSKKPNNSNILEQKKVLKSLGVDG